MLYSTTEEPRIIVPFDSERHTEAVLADVVLKNLFLHLLDDIHRVGFDLDGDNLPSFIDGDVEDIQILGEPKKEIFVGASV